ncbi:hypothetical protein D3C78_1564710 [compost metagenome]
MCTKIESEVALTIAPRCIVLHRNGARIAVVRKAMFFVLEGDAILDNMINGNLLSAQLESIAVAVRS